VSRAALGFRAHSGWAAMVALEGDAAAPRVILRRRLELLDRGMAGAAQPYHTAAGMNLEDAKVFLDQCRSATHAAACHAVRCAVMEIAKKGYQVAGGCVLLGSGRQVSDLQTILRSHPMLHTAEGEFYREAVRAGCAAGAVPVIGVREKVAREALAEVLGLDLEEVDRRVAELGKLIGPPWRQDEKLAAMGAWIVMRSNQ
jgi:hypothetical protein